MDTVLEVVKRTTSGKNANNRTRAAGHIPAVVYGARNAGEPPAPVHVAVDPKPLAAMSREMEKELGEIESALARSDDSSPSIT